MAKPRVLIWVTLEADLWPMTRWSTWKVISGGTSREVEKWDMEEKGEIIGCVSQMITAVSPGINLTRELWVMLLSIFQSCPPPRSESIELVSTQSCCHSLKAFSSDIKHTALMVSLCGLKMFIWWEKSLSRELHMFAIKLHGCIRSSEVTAKGLGMGHQLHLKIRYRFSHYTKIMSSKPFIC